MKKQIRKFFLFVVFLLTTIVLLNFTSCDTTEPTPNNLPDTTTQNFTFETFEFGDGFSSSYFKDVWIFDENNIWAVGYISTDSVSNANIMRWDGDKWYIDNYIGHSSGINGIWAIDSSNIFFANGAVLIYKEGLFTQENFQNLAFTNGQTVHKLWGSSANNIWGVGKRGTIVHFDGSEWKKIDFDEQWNLYDIIGSKKTGKVYVVGRNIDFTSIIIELKDETANIIFNTKTSEFPFNFTVLRIKNENELFIAGSDIGLFNIESRTAKTIEDLPVGYSIATATIYNSHDAYFFGTEYRDGVVTKKMIHYNGQRFQTFDLPERETIIYGDSRAINGLAIVVEFSNNKAYLLKIMRD